MQDDKIKRIRSLAYTVSDAVRAGRWDEAYRAVTALAPLLAERVENGSFRKEQEDGR